MRAAPPSQRCANCGYRSANPEVFRRERGRWGVAAPVCLACEAPAKSPFRPWREGSALLFLGLMALASSRNELSGAPGALLFFFGALLAGWPPAIIVHELGHAAISLAVRARVHSIRLGTGRVIWASNIGETRIELGENPMGGGHVQRYFPRRSPNRWQCIAVGLGGGLANLLAACGLIWLMAPLGSMIDRWPQLGGALLGLTAIQLWTCIANLWPFMHTGRPRRPLDNDGRRIGQTLLRGPISEVERDAYIQLHGDLLKRTGRVAEAARHYRDAWNAAPENTDYSMRWLSCLALAERPEAVLREAAMVGLADPHDPRIGQKAWAQVIAVVAWSALHSPDNSKLALADTLSARSYELNPGLAHIVTTRGAALIALGRRPAGATLLRTSLRVVTEWREKSEICRWLAQAEFAMGDIAIAQEYRRMTDWFAAKA